MRLFICLLLAAVASTGCKTMKSVTLDQMTLMGPERVWITEQDQSVVLMYEPKIVSDTVVGYVGRHREKMSSARVKDVRVQSKAPARTALLVGGIAATFIGFAILSGGTGESAPITSTTGPAGYCDIDPEQTICTGVPE